MGDDTQRVAVVFAGGDPPHAGALDDVPDDACSIAADSGLEHASALGRRVDLVVGDLDSVRPEVLAAAERAGTRVERHPTAKDATDLELALDAARDAGCGRIVVIGGHGGRVDHFVANLLLLGSPRLRGASVEARFPGGTVHVVRDALEIRGVPGDVVSLLPVGGAAHGVTTEHLRYPLRGETLHPGSTRGVSNELLATRARVTLTDGTLLAVEPHMGPERSGGLLGEREAEAERTIGEEQS
jgi:thiamine pyrophosphokinase